MAPEPRNNTRDMFPLLWNNWTELQAEENISSLNTINSTYTPWHTEILVDTIINSVTMLICLCGMLGNWIVIWLLSFRIKRNHFSVYILNLAAADFIYLLGNVFDLVFKFLYSFLNPLYLPLSYSRLLLWISRISTMCFYSVSLSLLMAISVERCVSVLWPIWYKCHRPTHLSTIVCTFIWVFFIVSWFSIMLFVGIYYLMLLISGIMSLPTMLVLFVSSLILFIRVQCYSRQRKPSRLYWTILLNVLAFLLLNVPRGVFWACGSSLCLRIYLAEASDITTLLCAINSTVNPIIYFFVGRHRQQRGRKTLREVLHRALTDEDDDAEAEERRPPCPHRA